jgi:hypothetical protein
MQEFWLSFWSQELSPYCQSEVPSCLWVPWNSGSGHFYSVQFMSCLWD